MVQKMPVKIICEFAMTRDGGGLTRGGGVDPGWGGGEGAACKPQEAQMADS